MTLSLRLQFAFIILLTLVATGFALKRIKLGIDLAGGAELRYKLLFDPSFQGDRAKAAREAADVMRRRVEAASLKEAKITTHGDDEVVVQLPGADADEVTRYKSYFRGPGDLKLYASASRELQERFDRDHVEPAGTKALRNGLLVEAEPVIEGRHIVAAEPALDGTTWVTLFELDREGARRFDEAAERLYNRSPRGRIAIVLDGVMRSAPVVNSPAFHGRGQISGGSSP